MASRILRRYFTTQRSIMKRIEDQNNQYSSKNKNLRKKGAELPHDYPSGFNSGSILFPISVIAGGLGIIVSGVRNGYGSDD